MFIESNAKIGDPRDCCATKGAVPEAVVVFNALSVTIGCLLRVTVDDLVHM
jgi:hypothetical protein